MKILCYGDSNTYGYNPQDFFGGTYRRMNRWPEILNDTYGYETVNKGLNGRELPYSDWQYDYLGKDIRAFRSDVLLVMLSTNDVLNNVPMDMIRTRAQNLCLWLKQNCKDTVPVIVIPVPCTAYGESSLSRCREAGELLRHAAEEKEIRVIDTENWEIPLAYDGIHYTAEGHVIFAEKMNDALNHLFHDEFF